MKIIDKVQGDDSWVAWRAGGCGASDAPLFIYGRHFDRTLEEFLENWLHRRPGKVRSNWAMEQGKQFEEVARQWYERRMKVDASPLCVEHDDHPFIRASLDGYVASSNVVVEIKYADKVSHRLALDEGKPAPKYEPQLWHQALVTGSKLIHYVSGNPRFDDHERICLVRYVPPQDKIDLLLKRLLKAYDALQKGKILTFDELCE